MGLILFQIWILSFLLYQVNIIGSLSIDNLLVPILVLTWFFFGKRTDARVSNARAKTLVFVAFVFSILVIDEIVKWESGAAIATIYPPIIEHLKHLGYILVPLLYISDEKSLRRALLSLLVITLVSGGLAVLGAVGLHLPFVHVGTTTRIPGLLRSRGPLVNQGDTALLVSLMALLVWTVMRHKIRFVRPRIAIRGIVFVVLIGGAIATQSRNVILTLVMAFSVYYWLRMTVRRGGGGTSTLVSLLGIVAFLGVVTAVILNANAIIGLLTNVVGSGGEGTVRDRLASYAHAIFLLKHSWLLGLSSSAALQESLFIAKIHSMWLGTALMSGVVGVALVFAMIIVSLRNAYRLARHQQWREYGLVLASFILASLWFSPSFYPGHTSFIFWVALGVALTARQTYFIVRAPASLSDSFEILKAEAGGKERSVRTTSLECNTSRPV